MRLKQLLSVALAVPLLTALAAADSRLTDISVQSNGNAAVVTIRANGALTHNEYRPVDNLLFVDVAVVDIGSFDTNNHTVSIPGISSYQVHSYKAANGSQIARVELTLASHASVQLSNEQNAVLVSVSTDSLPIASTDKAGETASTSFSRPSPVKPAAMYANAPVARVRGISVVGGHAGKNVAIRISEILTPKVLTLKSPDRLVIDLPNARSEEHTS